jgi:hypothetical protein
LNDNETLKAVTTIKILTSHQRWFDMLDSKTGQAAQALQSWLRDDEVQQSLQINRYKGILWFNQEAFEQLLWWVLVIAVVSAVGDMPLSPDAVAREVVSYYEIVKKLRQAEEESDYKVEKLIEATRK